MEKSPDQMKKEKFKRDVKTSKILLIVFLSSLAIYISVFSLVYMISDFLVILGFSMILIGPAYISNAMMVFTNDGYPIDQGKKFIDGKRLFGRTKTRGGFIGGIIFGFIVSFVINIIFYYAYPSIEDFAKTQLNFLEYIDIEYLRNFLSPAPYLILVRAIFCGVSAPVGDLTKSFIKRRFSFQSGQPFWIADQLDFILMTFLLNFAWFPLDVYMFLLLILMSPSVSFTANTVAYIIGKKTEPW